MDDSDVINFLLQTEIIPLCLRIMETGSELSKTVRVHTCGLRGSGRSLLEYLEYIGAHSAQRTHAVLNCAAPHHPLLHYTPLLLLMLWTVTAKALPCKRTGTLQVATFIVQKILLDEMGLNYICATAERFYAVGGGC